MAQQLRSGQAEAAPCRHCGQADEHVCVFCQVCGSVTRHVRRGRRWRCESCDERARLLGVRHVGFGMFVAKKLDLGVYGPPPEEHTKNGPGLEELYRDK